MFVTTKNQKLPKCSSAVEWIRSVSLHNGIPYSIDKVQTTASCHRMDKPHKCGA